MKNEKLQISLLPEEWWWGGAVSDGINTPFGDNLFVRDLTKPDENQGVPLLLSNKGRYVWCEAPFTFEFKDGILIIYPQTPEVIFEDGFETLEKVYNYVSKKYFPSSGRLPDELAFLSPQYNTWIEMFYRPTQKKVLEYADSIIRHGLPAGVLIIDDSWMIDYGNWQFCFETFPDPKGMVDRLHNMGFKVMLWVCPYVSPDSAVFRTLQKEGLLLKNTEGTPVLRKWWNGYSAVLDYTDAAAVEWFSSQLNKLVEKYGIDGFKFDAGDPSGSDINGWSGKYVWNYYPYENYDCEAYAKIGLNYSLSEYRACWKMGGKHLIQRQKDKKPAWKDNGLDSLIPNGVLQGLMGYPFNCPDMIGGGLEGDINSADFQMDMELFIRYMQCSVFFPIIQFSIAPWRVLDQKHFEYCLKMLQLRQKFVPEILKLARHAADTGEPIIRHMEYAFPGNGFEKINDQFMFGNRILVAPVLEKGAVERSIAFPGGRWVGDDGSIVQGPTKIKTATPIDRLPYYTLCD